MGFKISSRWLWCDTQLFYIVYIINCFIRFRELSALFNSLPLGSLKQLLELVVNRLALAGTNDKNYQLLSDNEQQHYREIFEISAESLTIIIQTACYIFEEVSKRIFWWHVINVRYCQYENLSVIIICAGFILEYIFALGGAILQIWMATPYNAVAVAAYT